MCIYSALTFSLKTFEFHWNVQSWSRNFARFAARPVFSPKLPPIFAPELEKYNSGNKEIRFQNWRNMIQFERITIQLISYWRSHFQFHFIDSYWCRKGKHQTNQIEIFHSFRHLLHCSEVNRRTMMINYDISLWYIYKHNCCLENHNQK